MTEASVKSGALITVTFGQEQNRKVFAVPGSVDSYPSSGYDQLFSRNRAKLIISVTDILEDLLPTISNKGGIQLSNPESFKLIQLLRSELNEQQIMIIDILNEGAKDLDNLSLIPVDRCNQVLPLLLEMNLQGLIQFWQVVIMKKTHLLRLLHEEITYFVAGSDFIFLRKAYFCKDVGGARNLCDSQHPF